jgi:predicted Rdx family selenoprotein
MPVGPAVPASARSWCANAGEWPDAFSETLADVAASPSTGNVLDITKTDTTVFSNP